MIYSEQAHAKVNLFLDITGKLENGYHIISSIMQSVTLCDTLEAEICEGERESLELVCGRSELSAGEENLVCRAARAYIDKFGIKNCITRVTLNKNIPIGAGLAGGSADAGAMLRIMQKHYGLADERVLSEIARSIGADVPFCLREKTSLCTGIGDIMSDCPSLSDCYIVISKSDDSVSTPLAYSEFDRLNAGKPFEKRHGGAEELSELLGTDKDSEVYTKLFNCFENIMLPILPKTCDIKRIMLENGAKAALMSGSGPAIFGIFKSFTDAVSVAEKLSAVRYFAYICQPYNRKEL